MANSGGTISDVDNGILSAIRRTVNDSLIKSLNEIPLGISGATTNIPEDDIAIRLAIVPAVDTLSSTQRKIIADRYCGGMTYEQIGKTLGGISLEAARTRVLKAEIILRRQNPHLKDLLSS